MAVEQLAACMKFLADCLVAGLFDQPMILNVSAHT
jgi:hypothetical protein